MRLKNILIVVVILEGFIDGGDDVGVDEEGVNIG